MLKFITGLWCLCTLVVFADSHHPQAFLEQIKNTPNEGAQIVEHFCQTCHAEKPMIALGAPRQGHMEDWGPRVGQGIDIILKHTYEGLRAMPPRGGCFECTDEQLWLAIKALLPPDAAKDLDKKR